ncbi:AAC(3) family N-acetyltransferase [Aeromonas veronii]|uniref:AAC(3) family N-acetyltransferase n=1 Tax=Aeromonas TaxID=642 RepID=UPI0021E912D1|nr:AAC(3) family N-acetyltransferase [Aeromonas veronii]MCV3284852.1 AAC(3) family N-acetyltransferase [Aeromonas veronii]
MSNNMFHISSLRQRWLQSGIAPGDAILIHSNIKRTLLEYKKNGSSISPGDIFDSLLDVLGQEGTLLLPLFNFDFTKGMPFDIRTTPSQMGALTEVARKHKDAIRTGHPIYSFAVIGKYQKLFYNVDNESGYAEDSPFGILKHMGGKIASLDLEDQYSMTFYHHIEEVKMVSYRYFKEFSGDYTNIQGETTIKKYKLYVRDIERGVVTNVNPAGELLWSAGLYKGFRPRHGSGLRTINAADMFNYISKLIDDGKARDHLFSIEER